MKKFLVFLVLIISSAAIAQPVTKTIIKDQDSTNSADVVQANATDIANSLFGLVGLNAMYIYDNDNSKFVAWNGQIYGEARTSQQSAASNGDPALVVANENGELVISGYAWSTNAIRASEVDPISAHYVGETLLDLTDISTNTTDYAYIDMSGYKGIGLQIETSGATPTDVLTVTFECSLLSDGTAPASCTYQDVTNDLFGVASAVDSDDYWTAEFVPAKYCRIVYVTSNDSGDDADLTVYLKKLY